MNIIETFFYARFLQIKGQIKPLTLLGALLLLTSQFNISLAAPPEHPADFRNMERSLAAKTPYQYVFGSNGIDCSVADGRNDARPRIGNSGHFFCPCLRDLGCQMANPHILEESGVIDPKVIAKAPRGSSCDNAIPWTEARQNVGRTLVVVGRVASVTTSAENQTSIATWINVGEPFPSVNRLTLVIWNDAPFKLKQPKTLEGKFICAVGKILSHRGSAQIAIRSAEEFVVSQ